eukprot:274353_1
MALSQFSPTSPLSQQSSSSDASDSNSYEDLLCHAMESSTNNTAATTNHSNTTIVYASERNTCNENNSTINGKRHSNKPIHQTQKPNSTNNKNHYEYPTRNTDAAAQSDEDNDENIAKILAQHPCTPRPRTLPYDSPAKPPQDTKKKKGNRKKKNNIGRVGTKSDTFSKNTLKPITTPRPESVGVDSTDSEEDDDELPSVQPDELDDITAIDDYHLRRKEKWCETQKGPTYAAYTTGGGDEDNEAEKKQSKPCTSNTMQDMNCSKQMKKRRHAVRGAEYFPANELDGRYEFIRYLGHGAYGYVAEGRHIATGKKVAIKKILRIFHNRIDAKRLLRELKILRVLRGLDSIVQLIDILPPPNFDTFNQIILVFEFIDTDLSKLIGSDQYFTKLHVQYMLYQVLAGVKFMHSLNIFHRDLKPANILVNEDVSLKICDFGLARCTYNNHQFEAKKKESAAK